MKTCQNARRPALTKINVKMLETREKIKTLYYLRTLPFTKVKNLYRLNTGTIYKVLPKKKKTFYKTLIDFVGKTNVKRIMLDTSTDTLMAQRPLFKENNGPGSACGGLWWCIQHGRRNSCRTTTCWSR